MTVTRDGHVTGALRLAGHRRPGESGPGRGAAGAAAAVRAALALGPRHAGGLPAPAGPWQATGGNGRPGGVLSAGRGTGSPTVNMTLPPVAPPE